jgi:hypothetical protein
MKIRLLGAELFHVDGHTDRYGEANGRFSQFCERAKKWVRTRSFTLLLSMSLAQWPLIRATEWLLQNLGKTFESLL